MGQKTGFSSHSCRETLELGMFLYPRMVEGPV